MNGDTITMGILSERSRPASLDRDAAAQAFGQHKFTSPPPPGIRASLVVVCALGVILAVFLIERAAYAWHTRHVQGDMTHETDR